MHHCHQILCGSPPVQVESWVMPHKSAALGRDLTLCSPVCISTFQLTFQHIFGLFPCLTEQLSNSHTQLALLNQPAQNCPVRTDKLLNSNSVLLMDATLKQLPTSIVDFATVNFLSLVRISVIFRYLHLNRFFKFPLKSASKSRKILMTTQLVSSANQTQEHSMLSYNNLYHQLRPQVYWTQQKRT